MTHGNEKDLSPKSVSAKLSRCVLMVHIGGVAATCNGVANYSIVPPARAFVNGKAASLLN
jgi:hypothetical protein